MKWLMELFSLAQVFIWYSRLHANELLPSPERTKALQPSLGIRLCKTADGWKEGRQREDLLATLNKRPHWLRRGSGKKKKKKGSLVNGIELYLLSADFTMMRSAHVTGSLSMKIS